MLASDFRAHSKLHSLAAALLMAGLCTAVAAAPLCRAPDNLISNPGFESGVWAPGGKPAGWTFNSWNGTSLGVWDNGVARSGQRSARIDARYRDDASWQQAVPVPLKTPLYLEGWIQSDNVQIADPYGSPGATISALERWDQTAPTYGTTPWHKVGMTLQADKSPMVVGPRIGFWSGLATGSAWFDDLRLVPLAATAPHPRWKILLLVYAQTDVVVTAANGTKRHVVGTSTQAELDKTAEQARLFVEQDVPALTSGQMLPTLTVRHARAPMQSLSPLGAGYWPAPKDVQSELDPAFDSVIVVWDPRVKDVTTGASLWIGAAAGLTLPRGTGQTYTTVSVEYAGVSGHRNVYKHEWGHSILSFYEALQRTPQPTVTNHAVQSQYVQCKTGRQYVWLDETNANPIPNSIYSNSAGFTHDYYSGTVARAEDPATCLGIGPDAWAWGGPASHSGTEPVFTAAQRVQALIEQLNALEAAQMLDARSSAKLRAELARAQRGLGTPHGHLASASLKVFSAHVQKMAAKGALLPQAALGLVEAAETSRACAMTPG